jgi:S-adenosylmethionine hydrolase
MLHSYRSDESFSFIINRIIITPNNEEVGMSLVTLMTDFGLKDGNVGVMKGVILGIAPQSQIVDLSHLIQPQDILEAGLILRRSALYFPPATVHVVVVDPGVGTQRRPLAAQVGTQFYVGPDNGTMTLWVDYAREQMLELRFYHLDQPEYWLEQVSHVFHGRDIFAPVAAHLANGVRLDQLGTPIVDPVRQSLPQPIPTATGWVGEVIHIDHFGNISTNILAGHLQGKNVRVLLGGATIEGLVATFGERNPGELVALFGSTGNLILAEVNGNAAQRLQVVVGVVARVEWLSS